MGRKILFLFFSALWLWNCSKESASEAAYMGEFRQAVLKEINLVRQTPGTYVLQRLGANLESYNECNGGDNGLATDLTNNYSALPALELDDSLGKAAQKYAQFLHQSNKFGHTEKGSPSDRCRAEGYPVGCGENLAYQAGTEGYDEIYWNAKLDAERSAKNFVLQLLIDCGVANLGHRRNMLDNLGARYKKLGVGYYQGLSTATSCNGCMKHMHVQNFGSQ